MGFWRAQWKNGRRFWVRDTELPGSIKHSAKARDWIVSVIHLHWLACYFLLQNSATQSWRLMVVRLRVKTVMMTIRTHTDSLLLYQALCKEFLSYLISYIYNVLYIHVLQMRILWLLLYTTSFRYNLYTIKFTPSAYAELNDFYKSWQSWQPSPQISFRPFSSLQKIPLSLSAFISASTPKPRQPVTCYLFQ